MVFSFDVYESMDFVLLSGFIELTLRTCVAPMAGHAFQKEERKSKIYAKKNNVRTQAGLY